MNFCHNKEDDLLIGLNNINKSFEGRQVLKDISLSLYRGEFVSIIGSSGCGKSTLFNIITGLVQADSGSLTVNGDIGYMRQKDLLLPWKTTMDNVVLPLDLKGAGKKASREKAGQYIDMMGLKGYEDKYPHQLSGGMRQRASFLRTFLSSGEIMLLDEPFGALDAITRGRMQKWLLEMKEALNTSIAFITHDIEEAVFLSDRIYILSERPGTVKEEIAVDFLKGNKSGRLLSPELLKIKEDIAKKLSDEI